jgi:very-short-patch-repair endonuclease
MRNYFVFEGDGMGRVYNRQTETIKRRDLRNNMPKAEAILWSKLRRRQMMGYKFRRQFSINQYVVDFYCPELKLAIELDGDTHFIGDAVENDEKREIEIEDYGVIFLRFQNNEIYRNLNGVLITIAEKIKVLEFNK